MLALGPWTWWDLAEMEIPALVITGEPFSFTWKSENDSGCSGSWSAKSPEFSSKEVSDP